MRLWIVTLCLGLSSAVSAADLESGAAWLASTQQASGELRGDADSAHPYQGTAEAVTTLSQLSVLPAVRRSAVDHLSAEAFGNTEWLARTLFTRFLLPFEVAALEAEVAERPHDGQDDGPAARNRDGAKAAEVSAVFEKLEKETIRHNIAVLASLEPVAPETVIAASVAEEDVLVPTPLALMPKVPQPPASLHLHLPDRSLLQPWKRHAVPVPKTPNAWKVLRSA